MSLEDLYIGMCESMESKKSKLVSLLEDITEPSCLQSGEKFQFLGKSDGENRSFGGFFHDLCKRENGIKYRMVIGRESRGSAYRP